MSGTTEEQEWAALAARAERGDLRPIEGTAVTGPRAAERGQAALLAATGAASIEDAALIAFGRPKVGETRDTHIWRVRASADLDAMVTWIAEREGRTRSQVIRDAVAQYAAAHS